MPMPNFHAIRLADPNLKGRWWTTSYNNGIQTVNVQTEDGPITQSIHFDSALWTVAQARAWLRHEGIDSVLLEPATGSVQARRTQQDAMQARVQAKFDDWFARHGGRPQEKP